MKQTIVALLIFSATGTLLADPSARPNIVLIMADDLGYECLGANGSTSYKTPVLDQMAKRGLRFEHCYAQPLCTPTRVQLMTGMYNVRNYVAFGKLEESQTTFSQLLKQAGYATCIVGKWQLGRDPRLPKHFGFDEHCLWQLYRRPSRYANPGLEVNGKAIDYDAGGYGPAVVSRYACDFIERNKKTPFLLYYPMIITHCPFEPTPDSKDWDPKSPGSKSYKGKAKYFGDMVTYMDKTVGKILAKLESAGVRDNTIVIFTGDNGTDKPVVSRMADGSQIAGGKGKMTDAGTRVPLIVDWPGKTPGGKVCGDLVDFSDFFPTICQAAGIEIPTSLKIDGHSFLGQLQGEQGNPREWIYCWYARNGGKTGREFARNQRYKLYRTGKFYDIANDRLEKNSILPSALGGEANSARLMLQGALDQFAGARPAEYANWKTGNRKTGNRKTGNRKTGNRKTGNRKLGNRPKSRRPKKR